MKKSTSIHSYNADQGLGFFAKFAYLFLNWVNNLFPYWGIDKRIRFEIFRPVNLEKELGKTYPNSSAARKFSDLFWHTLPWSDIKKELGEIHIFDTGCGSGNYGVRIMETSGGGVVSYTGIDAQEKPNWAELRAKYPSFNLVKSGSNDISSHIPTKVNLFITQSAIEHFDEDLRFFEQIREHIKNSSKPVMQIHLFPGAATLPLYLFHGLRQYTPRTISKITRLFDAFSKFSLYGLGGRASRKLHWKYFTWPVLIKHKYVKPTFDISEYEPKLRKAVKCDIAYPSKSPLFWALIIHSSPKSGI